MASLQKKFSTTICCNSIFFYFKNFHPKPHFFNSKAIQKLKKEIVVSTVDTVIVSAETRHYIEALLGLLSTAKPLNGNGYFQVFFHYVR